MGERKRSILRSHPNYVIGFFVWLCAIGSIIIFPNLFPKINFLKKPCVSCTEYSDFIESLTSEQKADFELLEAGAINIKGMFHIVGKNSNEEYDLYQKRFIKYQNLDPIIVEKVRRLIVLNSVLRTLSPETRNLVLNKQAVILFRDGHVLLVSARNEQEIAE